MKFKLTSQCDRFKDGDIAKMEALGFKLELKQGDPHGYTHEILKEDRWIEFATLEELVAFTSKAGPFIVFGVAGDESPPGNAMQQDGELQIHLANDYLDYHEEH